MGEVELDGEKILAIALRGVAGSAAVSLLGISIIAISISSSNDEKAKQGEGMRGKKGASKSCRLLSWVYGLGAKRLRSI